MKLSQFSFLILFLVSSNVLFSQSNRVIGFFPEGTVLHSNVSYNNDTLQKHLLDIYMPPNATSNVPLVIFIHGGGWLSNDKYADMGYMKKTISEIVSNGYALASIDYRFSTQVTFPAQIQDCNRAVSFLYDNASKYGFNKKGFVLMGFSAGGHLASLMGVSKNDRVNDFFMPATSRDFNISAVIDFYGPADLMMFPGNDDKKSPESLLIGAAPLDRPDLAKAASSIAYVNKGDPPFLIIHGAKDESVSPKQSQLLGSWLRLSDVPNEVIIVKDAPHFGVMFDSDAIRARVMAFLKLHLGT